VQLLAGEPTVTGPCPLAPEQRRFFSANPPTPAHDNRALLLPVDDAVDAALLERAVALLIHHHDALRLRFASQSGSWTQDHAASGGGVPFESRDAANPDEAADHIRAAQASLDLNKGPLLKVLLLQTSGAPAQVLLCVHRLVADERSLAILAEDLDALYRQLQAGAEPALPAKTESFQTWSNRLAARMPVAPKPWIEAAEPVAVKAGASAADNRAANTAVLDVTLDEARSAALAGPAHRAYHTRVEDLLVTALARAFSKPELVIDLEISGREGTVLDVARTVGPLTTVTPLELSLPEALPAALKLVKERLHALFQEGPANIWTLPAGDGALLGPRVLFRYSGALPGEPCDLARAGSANPRPWPLEISAAVRDGRLVTRFDFSTALQDRTAVAAMAEAFQSQLESLIDHCLDGGGGGFTPGDFPLADVDQQALDRLFQAHPQMEDLYRLSPMQEGMLFHTITDERARAYLRQTRFELSGEFHCQAFRDALERVMARHAVLRSSFHWEGLERPLQVVHRDIALPWHEEDWRECSHAEVRERLADFLARDMDRGMQVGVAPWMRFALLELADDRRIFVWTYHHLILDGWSLPRIFAELVTCYDALTAGGEADLPEPTPFRDYIAWLAERDPAGAESFWREYLAGLSAPTPLPGTVQHARQRERHRD